MSKIGGAKVMTDQPDYTAWNPLLIGDFDGDGVEDAVIIARNKKQMMPPIPKVKRVSIY